MWATWIPLFLVIGLGFAFTGGIVIYWLLPSLFCPSECTFAKSRTYSCHYHYCRHQLLRHLPSHRHQSSHVYYQLRHYKDEKQAAHIAHNRLIARLNGPWGSSESPQLPPPWAYPTIVSVAASDLFGMLAAWQHELLTNNHHFVDPIQQICSLKSLVVDPPLPPNSTATINDGKAKHAGPWLPLLPLSTHVSSLI